MSHPGDHPAFVVDTLAFHLDHTLVGIRSTETRPTIPTRRIVPGVFLTLAAFVLCSSATAQFAERPALAGSGRPDCDVSGRSVKNPRTRAIHTELSALRGGTAWFFERDPFLAYQLGRNLNFREFRERDGVFDARVSNLAGPMPDGSTAKITANNQVSCAGCHNLPQGNPGGGVSFHKDSGFGRNSPHYYGSGITEMLAIQTREKILAAVDADRSGWISPAEASAYGQRVVLEATPGGDRIDFGDPRLTRGQTGVPQLNNIFRVWYVDEAGRLVPGATSVDGVRTHGFNFAMVVWGWGQGVGRSALNPTNRAFLWDPWKTHGGLEAHDPSTLRDPDQDGVSEPTLAGAVQFPATHRAPDIGLNRDPLGFSRDDPDGDGHLTEISEGDLDLAEWFMLNAPRPAFAGSEREYEDGVEELRELGCATCHTPDWKIEAKRAGITALSIGGSGAGSDPTANYAGDRRFFDLDVRYDPADDRLEGTLVPLYRMQGEAYVRRFDAFAVEGIFTDFRHHDMGPGFEEVDFGGVTNRVWRTAPLWGVGSGFPWGHDGQSLTIEDAIQRHGGAADASRNAWNRLSRSNRERVLSFLSKLVLYDIESLPTDMDGDGRIAPSFLVAAQDTGYERFNPEWLFRVPVRIQGLYTNVDGVQIRSFAARNLTQAYALDLPLRRDTDLDGWPDAWDRAPTVPGFKDGVQN
jgi:hypothetical protein